MKTLSLFSSCIILSLSLVATSCDDHDDDYDPWFPEPDDDTLVMDPSRNNFRFNNEGYWSGCYSYPAEQLLLQGFQLSHDVMVYKGENGRQEYIWNGFCPSVVNDNQSYPDDWENHQWASIAGGIPRMENDRYVPGGKGYLVCCWDADESLSLIPTSPSLMIARADGKRFSPRYVYLTNSSYTYYCMKNGSGFNDAFGPNDWLKLRVVGVSGGRKTATVVTPLASDSNILNIWAALDLSALGEVDYIYFQMESTESDEQYGILVPPYFCMGPLVYNT